MVVDRALALDTIELIIWRMWGKPYRWGGDDPMAGFDCSGGILELLMSVGLWPHGHDATAQTLHDHFRQPAHGKVVPWEAAQTLGTLIFFGKGDKAITHVAMVYGDEVMFEFGGGGSKTKSEADAQAQNAYGRLRPIGIRQDLVTFIRPLPLIS